MEKKVTKLKRIFFFFVPRFQIQSTEFIVWPLSEQIFDSTRYPIEMIYKLIGIIQTHLRLQETFNSMDT